MQGLFSTRANLVEYSLQRDPSGSIAIDVFWNQAQILHFQKAYKPNSFCSDLQSHFSSEIADVPNFGIVSFWWKRLFYCMLCFFVVSVLLCGFSIVLAFYSLVALGYLLLR